TTDRSPTGTTDHVRPASRVTRNGVAESRSSSHPSVADAGATAIAAASKVVDIAARQCAPSSSDRASATRLSAPTHSTHSRSGAHAPADREMAEGQGAAYVVHFLASRIAATRLSDGPSPTRYACVSSAATNDACPNDGTVPRAVNAS